MVLALVLLVLGVLARFIPHAPNFTPVLAVALFGGAYLKRSQALLLPLVLMMITDMVLGFHPAIAFTWGSVLLISLMGIWLRERLNLRNAAIASVAASLLFFVVTNFGVWLAWYPPTPAGLVSCFTMALPFYRDTLTSTLVYSVVLFGGYEFIAARIRPTKLAVVLLKK